MNTAKIIAVTQPLVKTQDVTKDGKNVWIGDGETSTGPYMTAGEFIAYVARVSNPSNQHNTLTAPKLLDYLINHKHWSPFEMVSVTMEINTTRDIAHQIVRHRSFSFQEFSQRYADPTKDMGFTLADARLQDHKNRQNSIETDDAELRSDWYENERGIIEQSKKAYNWAIEHGIAKEVARKVLPEGLTNTRLYMAGTLRSWIHYIDVRAEEGTQKEHRQVALAARDEILGHFPSLNDYWYSAPVEIRDYTGTEKRCEHCFAPIERPVWKWSEIPWYHPWKLLRWGK